MPGGLLPRPRRRRCSGPGIALALALPCLDLPGDSHDSGKSAVGFEICGDRLIRHDNAREFRDVVFENNSILTLKNSRCRDFTPKADMGEGF